MQAGEKLGPYEITTLIGHGGMGEVYKARDPRLNRDVAIKSSREQFSERFEREASAIAALNHPNICTLYDVGPNYLVMEFVEGQTLSDRIKEGPISLEESLRLAHQIAEALENAHEKNITHRDLKPGNIMIRPDGTVKVLDFGLAKVGQPITSSDSVAVTASLGATHAGGIMGTPAYMAPEQAKGRPDVDKRSDIWAFGVVFYEMLTGQRLFPGDDLTEVLAAVVLKEPSLDKVPAQFRRLLKKCLEKDPKKRLRDIGDVWDYVGESSAEAEGPRHKRNVLWPTATVIVVIIAAAGYFVLWPAKPLVSPDAARRFNIPMPEKVTFGTTLRMSPNGRYVAFRGFGDGGSRLWLHDLKTNESRPLAGTEGVQNSPFWSPDSRTIVFGSQNRLMKASVSGGPPIKIVDTPSSVVNVGFFTSDNRIIFGTVTSGVFEVPAGGGTLKPLTELAAGEIQHAPQGLLPDGKHFLYLVRGASDHAGVNVRAFDDKPGAPGRRLLPDDTSALFAASNSGEKPGWIVFVREGTLLAQPFDPKRLDFAGDPVPLAPSNGNLGGFSLSETGDLVYGSATQGNRQLDWYDRKGARIETAWKGRAFNEIELSPDGTRVATADNPSNTVTIWVYDFERKSETQITSTTGVHPVWSPNGQRLVWVAIRNGMFQFYSRAASAADAEQPFAPEIGKNNAFPTSWSRDGRSLLFETLGNKGTDLMVLPIEGGKAGMPQPYVNGEGNETSAQFSPTGPYVAYVMTAGGRSDVYVRTFPDPSAMQWTISAGGGYQPRWRRDGTELFYITTDSKLMSVEVKPGPSFGVPKELFQVPIFGGGPTPTQIRWDTRDGQKFLINTVTGDTSAPLTVILNWQAGL